MHLKRGLVVVCLFLYALSFPMTGRAETTILNIRHWSAPDHTRVVLDVSQDPVYRTEKDDRVLRLYLEEVVFPRSLSRILRLKKPAIDRIEVTPDPEKGLLVELFLNDHTQTKVFKLQPIEDKPYRVVIDIVLPDVEKRAAQEREQVKKALKKKIVVIDPGHGGDDPGAVGKSGTYEKNIVLAISRKIKEDLDRKPGYSAFLTRDGDYYVPFRKRLQIAREYQADLFLSIHADAERSRLAEGASVYVLSLRGASSEAARILARNENLADIVGGVANGEAIKEASDPIILNMFQTNTLNASKSLGATLLKNLAPVNRLKCVSVQEAPFMVLKLPEIPSVLVETAYISNPREEKLLRTRRFQKEIASAVARAAVEFLEAGQAPGITEPALVKQTESSVPASAPLPTTPATPSGELAAPLPPAPKKATTEVVHRVKKGENLHLIAEKYGTSVSAIVRRNDLKPQKPLYVDLRLKIPAASGEGREEPRSGEASNEKRRATEIRQSGDKGQRAENEAVRFHTVVQGETLGRIAAKNGVPLGTLLRWNDMKPGDRLLAGRRIKIPDMPRYYVVKRGDSLEKIARKHHTTVEDLRKRNETKKLSPLYVNQRLVVSDR